MERHITDRPLVTQTFISHLLSKMYWIWVPQGDGKARKGARGKQVRELASGDGQALYWKFGV